MTPALEQSLRSLMVEHEFRRGDKLSGSSLLTSHGFYIQNGSARVYIVKGGKEHTVSFSFDDNFIVVSRRSVEAGDDTLAIEFLEQTHVLMLSHSKIREMLDKSKRVNVREATLFHCAALQEYASVLEERITVLQYYSARERYRWALERYPRLTECATVTQIASFLGLTKETLYRIRSDNYIASAKQHK